MIRTYGAILVMLATVTSACVSARAPIKPAYYKPGVTLAQLEADEARCVVNAIGGGTEFKPVLHIDREAVNQCMTARGYLVRRAA